MFSTMKTGEKKAPYLVELVVDTAADIGTLLTHYAPGSTCFVIEDSSTYMLNNQKIWKLVNLGGSGGGGGGTVVEGSLATTEDIDNLFA